MYHYYYYLFSPASGFAPRISCPRVLSSDGQIINNNDSNDNTTNDANDITHGNNHDDSNSLDRGRRHLDPHFRASRILAPVRPLMQAAGLQCLELQM